MAIMATHGDYYVTNPAKVGVDTRWVGWFPPGVGMSPWIFFFGYHLGLGQLIFLKIEFGNGG